MLQKTVSILEQTIDQVKRDKEIIEEQNLRLKEYLTTRDIDVDVTAYHNHIKRQEESLGR